MVDPTELGLSEGDEVEVMRVGTNGWWYARHMRTDQEGWVPSTFLEPVSRAPSLYSSSGELSLNMTVSLSLAACFAYVMSIAYLLRYLIILMLLPLTFRYLVLELLIRDNSNFISFY